MHNVQYCTHKGSVIPYIWGDTTVPVARHNALPLLRIASREKRNELIWCTQIISSVNYEYSPFLIYFVNFLNTGEWIYRRTVREAVIEVKT